MPSRKHKPGKYGTTPAQAVEQGKSRRQRTYEASLKEACARWLWEAERQRPDSWHSVPLVHINGSLLLKEAGYVEGHDRRKVAVDEGATISARPHAITREVQQDVEDIQHARACRLTPAFKTWWCSYEATQPSPAKESTV